MKVSGQAKFNTISHPPSALWWAGNVSIKQLPSGRWRVVAESIQAAGVRTSPIRAVVYAPSSCETAHNALCWASHSKAWERIRLHSQGSALLQAVKAKFPDQECRKEIFHKFCHHLKSEFGQNWLYQNQDAQDVAAKSILGMSSSRRVWANFLPIAEMLKE